MKLKNIVRPDSKNRVCLGALAKRADAFVLTVRDDGTIILEPQIMVPGKRNGD